MAWKHPSTLTSSTDLEEGCDIALDFERFLSASGQGVLRSSLRMSNPATSWCWRTRTRPP